MSSERQAYNEDTPWWGEHIHRYHEALKYATTEMQVLDIATGNGFGAYLLAEKTAHVTGADISPGTIEICRKNFNQKNLSFEVIDGTKMPMPENSLDLIVSFETIEHTTLYREMLDEFKRCLKPGGLLIVSTPNIEVNSPGGRIVNPYHTQEFNYDELHDLLVTRFSGVKLGAQVYTRYTRQRKPMARFTEKLLYKRGIRKIPLRWQNKLMRWNGIQQMYPLATDYAISYERESIRSAKTFFAVCTK